MMKIIKKEKNKDFKILDLENIRKFLNIISQKDDNFLNELYDSAVEYAENLLGVCIGEGDFVIQYFYPNRRIKLKYGPVYEIKSCKIINLNGNESDIKNFRFSKDTQEIFFDFSFPKKIFSLKIDQKSKMDDSLYEYFDSIKLKLLRHINLLYKNRNSNDLNVANIYQDLINFLE